MRFDLVHFCKQVRQFTMFCDVRHCCKIIKIEVPIWSYATVYATIVFHTNKFKNFFAFVFISSIMFSEKHSDSRKSL